MKKIKIIFILITLLASIFGQTGVNIGDITIGDINIITIQ